MCIRSHKVLSRCLGVVLEEKMSEQQSTLWVVGRLWIQLWVPIRLFNMCLDGSSSDGFQAKL